MDPDAPLFWFDYVDPWSFLVEIRLREAEEQVGLRASRAGVEIVPPPGPPIRGDDPVWSERWERSSREAGEMGLELARPRTIPWTRKAHELAAHSVARGLAMEFNDAVFRAHHLDGDDIGRIDVLVEIGARIGLDPGEARTVLGVDRYLEQVRSLGESAEREGVRGVPTLAQGARRLEGLARTETIAEFLVGRRGRSAPGGDSSDP